MAILAWQPGTLYNPGTLVQRATNPAPSSQAIVNKDFDDGDTGWTKGTGWDISTSGDSFNGDYAARLIGPATDSRIVSTTPKPVNPGQKIIASCRIRHGDAEGDEASCAVELDWLDADNVLIYTSTGNVISGGGDDWKKSTVEATAPAGAAFVRIAAKGSNETSHYLRVDAFIWDLVYAAPLTGLVFRAVQADAGYSGSSEPTWPAVAGEQVIDNQVTWEAIAEISVTWEASPILVSDYLEPEWPLHADGEVTDGTIIWTAITRRVESSRCPHSVTVALAAQKVFSGDEDIIPYSATVNPLDWTTPDDSGYLPYGLQTHGANPVAALGLYRGNLVAFNSAGFQVWQVDPDPQNMALLDAIPVGCSEPRSVQPIGNDMLFLSAVGVRSIAIAGASTNMQAGSVGEPIDVLTLAKIREGAYQPISLFWPAYGQYWLIFGDEAFVYTISDKKRGSWSRYVFPEAITDTTLVAGDLYLRTASHKVWKVTDLALMDDMTYEDVGTEFSGIIQWPHLDFGGLGTTKTFIGVDLVAEAPEGVDLSVGYDQRDLTARTADYTIDADSLPGYLIPIPVSGPSFDFRLTFAPNQAWEWFASVMYITDQRLGA